MTSSNNFTAFLHQSDFAEMARERKKQILIDEAKARKSRERKAAEVAEQARLAALPKITAEDLEKAEQTGFEKGIIDGKNQAKQELREEFDQHLGSMRQQIKDIPVIIKEQLAFMQKASLHLTREILSSTIAHASKHYSEEILEFTLKEAIEKSQKKAQLIINLSPTDRFYLEKEGHNIFKDLDITLKEDETITDGDCLINWDNSGVDARLSSIHQEIDKVIDAAARGIKADKIEFDFIQTEVQEKVLKEESINEEILDIENNKTKINNTPTEENNISTEEGELDINELQTTKEEPCEIEKHNEDVTNENKKGSHTNG